MGFVVVGLVAAVPAAKVVPAGNATTAVVSRAAEIDLCMFRFLFFPWLMGGQALEREALTMEMFSTYSCP
jgi:hypothetical protein